MPLRRILAAQPGNFETLVACAFVEAKLQDFTVSRGYDQRALQE